MHIKKITEIQSKPFLKWAGGKHKLAPILAQMFGEGDRLVEPFVGSGAVFMRSCFDSYLLCDTNNDLISLFNNLKMRPDELIKEVRALFTSTTNTEESFYTLRDEFNGLSQGVLRRNALFVYLNKHAFNGLCRYNSSGKFNVPYGRYESPKAPYEEMLMFSEKSQIAEFKCLNFADTFKLLERGDIVYCDPPYVPLSSTAKFTSYHTNSFGIDEQIQLGELAHITSKLGYKIVVSNHDTSFTRDIYKAARIYPLEVRRSISSKSSTRGNAKEIIAIFGQ